MLPNTQVSRDVHTHSALTVTLVLQKAQTGVIKMKTTTLEPETVTPGKSKSKKAKSSSNNVDLGDLSNLIDDQSVIYSSQLASQNDSLLPTIRAMPDSSEWKTVKSKSSKGQKKHSFSSDHTSVEDVPVAVPVSVPKQTTKAKNSNSTTNNSVSTPAPTAPAPSNDAGQQTGTDPAKRLRNLRKKLKEIESLKSKDTSTLEKEQLDKLKREDELLEQIEQFAKLVEQL